MQGKYQRQENLFSFWYTYGKKLREQANIQKLRELIEQVKKQIINVRNPASQKKPWKKKLKKGKIELLLELMVVKICDGIG